ncbi:MAG: WbqC family protein [Nitrosopumilus sp.]|uniref:WbqC family protein n=1 Tax=Nitrosopumilus sp. TaxID=2024843 RepID=UPI00247CEC90|nr:WbqC family protein [Nitrosopumilus sp.]MCV0393511.1 WbqC family protein [Nitrosopumilus sp.]
MSYTKNEKIVVSIIQPALFPWLGYFDIINKSDFFIFFDNVKFEKRNWQMRNKLKIISEQNEKETWISLPTKEISQKTLIKDALIDNTKNWKSKHMTMFRSNYGKNVNEIKFLIEMYEKNWDYISDFNIEFITKCSQYLQIDTKFVKASSLNVDGKRSQLLLNICKKLNATEYLSGPKAKTYLDADKQLFENENIKITYHDYKHPIYNQKGNLFIEKLSILDLLFNEKEKSREYFQFNK